MTRVATLFLFVVLLLLPRCASVYSGRYETITVRSEPNAEATLDCEGVRVAQASTPASIRIRRNIGDCILSLTSEGYVPQSFLIEQGVNPAYWLNFVLSPAVAVGIFSTGENDSDDRFVATALITSGGIGWFVDHFTGASHIHRPATVDAILRMEERENEKATLSDGL